jgi:hypothetical protein
MLYTGILWVSIESFNRILWAAEWGSIGYVQGIITASNLRYLSVSQNGMVYPFSVTM